MPPRTKLTTGASKAAKSITALITVVLTVIAAFTGLVAYGFLVSGERTRIGDTVDRVVSEQYTSKLDTIGIVGGAIAGAIALVLLWLALYLLLRAFRRGAWLEGSVLHVRGAMSHDSANLALATVAVRGQRLVAGKVSVPLTLPQEELLMLANAIGNTRTSGDPAHAVAERLRGAARDPFS